MASSTTSSPDPLALSYDENTLFQANMSRRSSMLPLAHSSPNTKILNQYLHTPSKIGRAGTPTSIRSSRSFTMRTPSRSGSPLKIRVTLEADSGEPLSPSEVTSASRQHARTRTITVPLRDEEQESPGRRTPRNRLSVFGSSVKTRLTPYKLPGVDRSDWAAHDETDLSMDHVDTAIADGVNVQVRRRGRSRKIPVAGDGISQLSSAMKRSAGDFELSQGSGSNKRVSRGVVEDSPHDERLQPDAIDSSISSNVSTEQQLQQADEEMWRNMIRNDSIMEADQVSVSSHVDDDMDDGGIRPGMEDDTSVLDRSALESEGFSMVSIDSLRNQKSAQSMPVVEEQEEVSEYSHAEQESDLQRSRTTAPVMKAASSTPPVKALSPMPPPVLRSSPTKTSPTRISPTVKAGAALQKAVNDNKSTVPTKSPGVSFVEGEVFSGFGTGTRRNLRAGLMMGELLARGERGFMAQASTGTTLENNTPKNARTPISNVSSISRLPTPSDSENSEISLHEQKVVQQATPSNASLLHSELTQTQKIQARWQQERNEIVRQAMQATPSRVVVIGSDDNDKDVDMMDCVDDIWQEEANRSLEEERKTLKDAKHIQSQHEAKEEATTGAAEFDDLFEPALRPLRGKIPSPWRKSGHMIYSDEVEPEPSALTEINTSALDRVAADTQGHVVRLTYDDDSSDEEDYDNADEYSTHIGCSPEKSLPSLYSHGQQNKISHKRVNISEILAAATRIPSSPMKPAFAQPKSILRRQSVAYPEHSSPSRIFSEVEEPEVEPTQETFYDTTFPSSPAAVDVEVQIEPAFSPANLDLPEKRTESSFWKILNPYDETSFFYRRDETLLSSVAPISKAKFPSSSQNVNHSKSLFTKLASILWSSSPSPTPSKTAPVWSKTHYILLNRIWRASPVGPTSLSRNEMQTPRAKHASQYPYPYPTHHVTTLSPALSSLIGSAYSTEDYTLNLSEEHVRVVQVFIEEAAGRGVEGDGLWVGTLSTVAEDAEEDEMDGWKIEEWSGDGREEMVALRVFGLVAGHEMRRRGD